MINVKIENNTVYVERDGEWYDALLCCAENREIGYRTGLFATDEELAAINEARCQLLKKLKREASMDKFDELIKATVLHGSEIVEMPRIEYDVTGTPICPGHPKICLGSGDFPGFECCCDECDYCLDCYPEFLSDISEDLEGGRR